MIKRLQSFQFAFRGYKDLFVEEPNARIHLLAIVLVIGASFYHDISANEWIAVLLCIGAVLGTEIINTAIETLADFVSPEKQEAIRKVKDLSAAAVLTSAIVSVIVGIIIFGHMFY